MVAVTKVDAVDDELVELALEEARELVPEAEVVAVSAKTGAGLDELRAALARAAVESEPSALPTRLFVDRVFTLRGIGTVATGTLWSGSIGEGDELRAEPAGLDVRVRSVQVHDRPVDRAEAGQRVAVALPGIERSQLRRGDVLVDPGAYRPSYRLDVVLEELEEIPAGARVHVHHGTAASPARVARAGEHYAQLRLAEPFVAARGDRVVIRNGGTIGGGVVLDPLPPRRLDPERLAMIERGDVAATVFAPVREDSLRHLLGDREPEGVERAGGWLYSAAWLEELEREPPRRARRAPIRSIPESSRRRSHGPMRSCRCSASSAAAPSSISRAQRRTSATVPPTQRNSKRASARSRSRSSTGASPRTSNSRVDSSRSATATRSPPPPTTRRSASCSRSARRPARSPSPASATSPAAAAAPHSSCWSASMQTA